MADGRVTQASFTAGEISPELYSRRDLAKYQVGARILENFYVLPYGGVQNRPGFKFMAEVKNTGKAVRLGKFEAADDQAYLMEMGDLYFRYFYRGGAVLNGSETAETVTPYKDTDLPNIYSAQSNDILTITARNFAPRELANVSSGIWELSEINFEPSIDPPGGVDVDTHFDLTSNEDIGKDKKPRSSTYKVSSVSEDGEESVLSSSASSGDNVLGFQKNYNIVSWNERDGADTYNVYKEQNGVFGYIGYTDELELRDENILPDLTRGPVTGRNPFSGTVKYPTVCGFCQQRRVFAATRRKPQSMFMSASGDFNSMQVSVPARDDDAVEFALAANKKQDIFHMLSVDTGLIVFTRSGEWVVTGREGDVITPSSIFPRPQSYYGAHKTIKPLVAGEQILFVPSSGRKVYEMEYSIQVDRYKAANLALLSNHLFQGREIVAWDFAERPNGIVWCVMSDGEILSLTYLKEHDVWGWARHSTNGRALDVCVVPEGSHDTPYFLIERRNSEGAKRFIEYLPQRDFVAVEDCFFVDSGLSYSNSESMTVTSSRLATSLDLSAGDLILVEGLTFTDVNGNVTSDMSGRYIVSSGSGSYIITTEDEQLVTFPTSGSSFQSTTARVYKATSLVSGMEHLRGREVVALADGNVISGLTVAADGTVNLGDHYFRVAIGLAYASRFLSLDIVDPRLDAVGLQKATPRAFLAVDKSRGFSFGTSFDNLEEIDTRYEEGWGEAGALISAAVDIAPAEGWEDKTQAAVVQTYPLPLTITGITTDITYGG